MRKKAAKKHKGLVHPAEVKKTEVEEFQNLLWHELRVKKQQKTMLEKKQKNIYKNKLCHY